MIKLQCCKLIMKVSVKNKWSINKTTWLKKKLALHSLSKFFLHKLERKKKLVRNVYSRTRIIWYLAGKKKWERTLEGLFGRG